MATSMAQSTMQAALDNKVDMLSTHSDAEDTGMSDEDYARFVKATLSVLFSVYPSRSDATTSSLHSRKVDWRVLPLLGTLAALSLIDRSNLGLARTVGMDHDLVCYSDACDPSSNLKLT